MSEKTDDFVLITKATRNKAIFLGLVIIFTGVLLIILWKNWYIIVLAIILFGFGFKIIKFAVQDYNRGFGNLKKIMREGLEEIEKYRE